MTDQSVGVRIHESKRLPILAQHTHIRDELGVELAQLDPNAVGEVEERLVPLDARDVAAATLLHGRLPRWHGRWWRLGERRLARCWHWRWRQHCAWVFTCEDGFDGFERHSRLSQHARLLRLELGVLSAVVIDGSAGGASSRFSCTILSGVVGFSSSSSSGSSSGAGGGMSAAVCYRKSSNIRRQRRRWRFSCCSASHRLETSVLKRCMWSTSQK